MTRPFRRRVFYIPGFDPMPPRRYRELYRRESRLQAEISGFSITLPSLDAGTTGWRTCATFADGTAETRFEVLAWSDLVQASMRRGIVATYAQMLRVTWIYLRSGTLGRLMRLRHGPVLAALYPVAMLLLQLASAIAGALLTGWLVIAATQMTLLATLAGLVAGWGVLRLWAAQDHRLFVHYLIHDYAYTASRNGAYPPALEQRIALFAAEVARALSEDLDEVLVVGHSSGAYLAVSVVADVGRLARSPGGPALALLTLGQVVPMAAFLPEARRLRADLAWLSRQPDIFWLDVSAPGDPCCFALCDPVAVSGVAGPDQRWPLVISAAFSRSLSPRQTQALRWRWFRLHLQYLCAFERPGGYDYFAITSGPGTLAARFAGRRASPGRIATPVGPGLP